MRLSIPTPCHEDWQAMTPNQQGRYCASCAKTVVDFTRMSDAEVVAHLQRKPGQVCGRVTAKQLNRSLATTPLLAGSIGQPLRAGVATAALAVGLSGAAAAQSHPNHPLIMGRIAAPPALEQPVDTVPEQPAQVLGEIAPLPVPPPADTGRVVGGEPTASPTYSGKVIDASDGAPLIGASIIFYQLDQEERQLIGGCVTDIDGNFSYASSLPADLVEISYFGYETTHVRSPQQASLDLITLAIASASEVIYMGGVHAKRPLHHRLLGWHGGHRIGNAFSNLGSAIVAALSSRVAVAPEHLTQVQTADATTAGFAKAKPSPRLTLAPNPTRSESNLKLVPLPSPQLVNVYSPSGQLVRSIPVAAGQEGLLLQTDRSWAAGTYLVELLDVEGQRVGTAHWVILPQH